MHDIDRIEIAVTNRDRVTGTANPIAQHRVLRHWQPGEIRPDDVIEKVVLYGAQCFFPRVHCQRDIELLVENPVRKHRKSCNMIQVSVRQEYVSNRIQICKVKIANTSTGIDQHIVIDQHRRGACSGAYSAAASKYTNSHREGFS